MYSITTVFQNRCGPHIGEHHHFRHVYSYIVDDGDNTHTHQVE